MRGWILAVVSVAGLACGRIGFDGSIRVVGDARDDATLECAGLGGSRYDDRGNGTPADPYRLCTAAQWLDLAGRPGGWSQAFELDADLDLGSVPGDHPPIGTPAMPFTGSLDGAGRVVGGYRNQSGASYLGLFGYIDGGGTIHDLGVRNADILSSEVSGAVVGFLGAGSVQRVASFGPSCYVRSSGYANHKGGLIGETAAAAVVVDVFSNCRLGGGGNGVAGLIGHHDGSLTNGYYEHAGDPVTGNGKVGGLIGWNFTNATVRNTFVATAVAGDDPSTDVALHIGLQSGTATSSYYDTTRVVTNANPSGGSLANGIGVDTSTSPGYFFDRANPPLTSWDFGSIWEVRPGSYPILRFLHGKL